MALSRMYLRFRFISGVTGDESSISEFISQVRRPWAATVKRLDNPSNPQIVIEFLSCVWNANTRTLGLNMVLARHTGQFSNYAFPFYVSFSSNLSVAKISGKEEIFHALRIGLYGGGGGVCVCVLDSESSDWTPPGTGKTEVTELALMCVKRTVADWIGKTWGRTAKKWKWFYSQISVVVKR